MPHEPRPGRRRRRAALAAVATALAVSALPAAASAACPETPTTKAFAQFGDTADYSPVPGGDFEAGGAGWTLSRTAALGENERFKVRAPSDARSLVVKPGGEAVSPPLCVSKAHPTFRFFARQLDGAWATMFVKLRVSEAGGATRDMPVTALSKGFGRWEPSPSVMLAKALPLWQKDQTATVRLVFAPMAGGGSWAIDDVMVDPFRGG